MSLHLLKFLDLFDKVFVVLLNSASWDSRWQQLLLVPQGTQSSLEGIGAAWEPGYSGQTTCYY